MIFSKESIFSDQQAITASAASTNVIDTGVNGADLGKGVPMPILIQVTEDFNTLTSLTVDLEVDDNEGMASAKVVQSASVLLADLVAGKQVPISWIPRGMDERYWRLSYTVVGTDPTTGKITAGLTMGNQDNMI